MRHMPADLNNENHTPIRFPRMWDTIRSSGGIGGGIPLCKFDTGSKAPRSFALTTSSVG